MRSPNERARFSAREDVLRDKSLSPGARFLYLVLDDLSGFKGESWYKQETLSHTYGISVRTIGLWLVELRRYVTVIRHQYTAIYLLKWSPRDRQPIADLSAADRQYTVGQIGSPLPISENASLYLMNQAIESGFKSTVKCPTCGDFGRVGGELHGPICECAEGAAIRARLNRRRA